MGPCPSLDLVSSDQDWSDSSTPIWNSGRSWVSENGADGPAPQRGKARRGVWLGEMPNWLLSIRRIKAFSELAISQSVVTSLDWTTIKEALVYCHVPTYIGRVLDDYLHNKYIEYSSRCAIDRRTNYIPAEIGAGILIVEHKAYDFACFPAG